MEVICNSSLHKANYLLKLDKDRSWCV